MRVLRGFSCAGDIGWVLPAENKRKTKQGQHPCLSIGMKVSIRILNSFLLSSVPALPGSLALTALPQYGSTS